MTRAVAGLGVAAALLVCLPGARPADAQTNWGTVRVPGGIGPARRIARLGGLDRPDASFLVDLSRRVTGTPLDPLDTPTELADCWRSLTLWCRTRRRSHARHSSIWPAATSTATAPTPRSSATGSRGFNNELDRGIEDLAI